MPEIELFATDDEIGELAKWLLDRNCELIPDFRYESESMPRLTKLTEIQAAAKATPHFFVVKDKLLESPLATREVLNADKRIFYIDSRTGGPILEFWWGRCFRKENRTNLSATWLSIFSWYIDSASGERKKPQKALVDLYSGFSKIVRANRRRIKPGKREFWVSAQVESLIRSGIVLVGLEDMSSDRILGYTTDGPSS